MKHVIAELLKVADSLDKIADDAGTTDEKGAIHYPEGKGPRSPWGPAQSAYPIERGVTWVSCAGHGGLGIAEGVARKKLSPAARAQGDARGGYYWYEEDVAYTIPFYEQPEWSTKMHHLSGGSDHPKEYYKEQIEKWFPEYFKHDGKEPMSAKEVKPGDSIFIDGKESKHEYQVHSVEGTKFMVRGPDAKGYAFPLKSFGRRVEKVTRDGKTIWEKKASKLAAHADVELGLSDSKYKVKRLSDGKILHECHSKKECLTYIREQGFTWQKEDDYE